MIFPNNNTNTLLCPWYTTPKYQIYGQFLKIIIIYPVTSGTIPKYLSKIHFQNCLQLPSFLGTTPKCIYIIIYIFISHQQIFAISQQIDRCFLPKYGEISLVPRKWHHFIHKNISFSITNLIVIFWKSELFMSRPHNLLFTEEYRLQLRKPHIGNFHLVHFVITAHLTLSSSCFFVGQDNIRWSFTWHQEHHLWYPKQKKSVWHMLKYVRKSKNCPKFKAFKAKVWARPIFYLWAKMEACPENKSSINLIRHANPHLLSPGTGCWDKVEQFWLTGPWTLLRLCLTAVITK